MASITQQITGKRKAKNKNAKYTYTVKKTKNNNGKYSYTKKITTNGKTRYYYS